MKLKWGIAAALTLALAIGIFALASEYGTQSDPLVSLSYITDVFKPEILREAKNESQKLANEANSAIDKLDSQVDSKINEFTDRNSAQISDSDIAAIADALRDSVPKSTANAPFATVTLAAGRTLSLTDGCEMLVRSGTVSLQSGAMIDTTTGGALTPGGSFVANHLYLASGACSIKASSDCVILISGSYK